jgi:hypothetical protein
MFCSVAALSFPMPHTLALQALAYRDVTVSLFKFETLISELETNPNIKSNARNCFADWYLVL